LYHIDQNAAMTRHAAWNFIPHSGLSDSGFYIVVQAFSAPETIDVTGSMSCLKISC
jgi:hypothetical protein